MDNQLLQPKVQEFVFKNLDSKVSDLALKGSPFVDVDIQSIIEQIESKKKSEFKLPSWYKTPQIYYPNKLNIEQTSSEITASYKSNLMSGESIVDVTGGFGVDCFYFSKQFKSVVHCEINTELSNIVEHNFKAFELSHIECVNSDGLEYLKSLNNTIDWIYIDPSRRHESKGKVFFLKDCLPNVPGHLDLLFETSDNIMIKTSPLLDISSGLQELMHVKDIHVVAVNNEVKELLWCLSKNYNGDVKLHTCNLTKKGSEHFHFFKNEEHSTTVKLGLPTIYLFEPNASILKSGGFKTVANTYKIEKLHINSHLYTGETLFDFPGRKFKILNQWPFTKSVLKRELPNKANVTTRNFPEKVENIRKKFKIKDGGSKYLFFTTLMDESKVVLECEKCD